MHVSYSGDGRKEAYYLHAALGEGGVVWRTSLILLVGSYEVTVYDHHGRDVLSRVYGSLTSLLADRAMRDLLANPGKPVVDKEKG
jgi:hypothetical protein